MLTIYIDMDDVLCDYSSKIKEHKQKNPDNPFPQSVPGFFRSLEPMDGALAAEEQLRKKRMLKSTYLPHHQRKILCRIQKKGFGSKINSVTK